MCRILCVKLASHVRESGQTPVLVARTATTGAATTTRRTSRSHSAAGGALVATTLEAKHRHHFFDFFRFAFWAIYGFITPENQSFKLLATFAAFVFINGHACSPIESISILARLGQT
jgi:hypothetical protein